MVDDDRMQVKAHGFGMPLSSQLYILIHIARVVLRVVVLDPYASVCFRMFPGLLGSAPGCGLLDWKTQQRHDIAFLKSKKRGTWRTL